MKFKIWFFIFLYFNCSHGQSINGIIGDNNWLNGWTNFRPKNIEYREPTFILEKDITTNTTLSKNIIYKIVGTIHVANNAVLTIEPGTILRGDFDTTGTITITTGSKIIAIGTENDPIIFTSNKPPAERKPGDWGGLILMGDAPINKPGGRTASFYETNEKYSSFGGNNIDSDSGILKYVRIEFAGKKIDSKIALNGLTLAGVGRKTKIDFVQVSFSSDDSFEIVGGVVDFNNLISYRASDDDYDYSMGVQSVLNNSIAIRNPYTCDNTRSRCLEIDSYDKPENADLLKNKTTIILNNVLLLNDEVNNLGLVKEAISLKTDSFLTINNCLIVGFTSFLALDEKYLRNENFKKINISNTRIDSCNNIITNELLNSDEPVNDWFVKIKKTVFATNSGIDNLFINNNTKRRPDYRLK
ncbi:MAG: hypothetical protein H7174_03275 [Flavobacterium sp.]|nr:hypothetical protein [Flavobacterium sp.]